MVTGDGLRQERIEFDARAYPILGFSAIFAEKCG